MSQETKSTTPTGKYGALIQKAKEGDIPNLAIPENQKTGLPESQKAGSPENRPEEVNLSIKVPKRLRRHWVSEAKRADTTLTAVIIASLREKFGEPQDDQRDD